MTNEPSFKSISSLLVKNPDATREELLELIVGDILRGSGRSLAEEAINSFFDRYYDRAKDLAKKNSGATSRELAELLVNEVKKDERTAEAMELH